MKNHHTELATGTCETVLASNGSAINPQPMKTMKMSNEPNLPLKYLFRKECICPICLEKETLNFFIGRMKLEPSKDSPGETEFVLLTPPSFFSYWGIRSVASADEASFIKRRLEKFVETQELVTVIGPCGKRNNEWAFFSESEPYDRDLDVHPGSALHGATAAQPKIPIATSFEPVTEIESPSEESSIS